MLNRFIACTALAAVLTPGLASAATDGRTGLPVYPGAAPLAVPMARTVMMCGHQTMTTAYTTKAAMPAVVAWYRSALGGVTPITRIVTSGDSADRIVSIATNGGSKMVNIEQTTYSASAGQLVTDGSQKVLVGLTTFSPPLSAAELANPKHHCT